MEHFIWFYLIHFIQVYFLTDHKPLYNFSSAQQSVGTVNICCPHFCSFSEQTHSSRPCISTSYQNQYFPHFSKTTYLELMLKNSHVGFQSFLLIHWQIESKQKHLQKFSQQFTFQGSTELLGNTYTWKHIQLLIPLKSCHFHQDLAEPHPGFCLLLTQLTNEKLQITYYSI